MFSANALEGTSEKVEGDDDDDEDLPPTPVEEEDNFIKQPG